MVANHLFKRKVVYENKRLNVLMSQTTTWYRIPKTQIFFEIFRRSSHEISFFWRSLNIFVRRSFKDFRKKRFETEFLRRRKEKRWKSFFSKYFKNLHKFPLKDLLKILWKKDFYKFSLKDLIKIIILIISRRRWASYLCCGSSKIGRFLSEISWDLGLGLTPYHFCASSSL